MGGDTGKKIKLLIINNMHLYLFQNIDTNACIVGSMLGALVGV